MNSPLHLIATALGVRAVGPSSCSLCGESPFPRGGSLGANFADYDLLAIPVSRDTCAGCERILGGRPGDEPPPLRTTSFLAHGAGFSALDRDGIRVSAIGTQRGMGRGKIDWEGHYFPDQEKN